MNLEKSRLAIMNHIANADTADRAARMLARIKIETHWLLLSTAPRNFKIDEDIYPSDRAQLVAIWPAIRGRRVAGPFYDVVGEHASLLANLIEIRRQRASVSKSPALS